MQTTRVHHNLKHAYKKGAYVLEPGVPEEQMPVRMGSQKAPSWVSAPEHIQQILRENTPYYGVGL
eukprot:1156877-Pelagomonas_calceolata.AAC.6